MEKRRLAALALVLAMTLHTGNADAHPVHSARATYEATLQSWVGRHESDLVSSSWGPPTSVYTSSDGVRILTYRDSRQVTLPGLPPMYHTTCNAEGDQCDTNGVGGLPSLTILRTCVTNFTIRNGFISNWSWRGNACF
jgi:hypothetical protein